MATEKTRAYLFGGPDGADGNSSQKALLGGKGANLAEMARVGLPVPPGFTLPTTICQVIESGDDLPDEVVDELRRGLKHVEETYGAKLGEGLTLSVRSGAAQSMPGMLDTILCLGLNDENAEAMAKRWGDARFAFDCYRRLISMYADVVMSCPLEPFEEELTRARRTRGCEHDHQLTADDMRKVADNFKGIYKRETGEDFPQDPWTQLVRAVTGVFGSWNNERAVAYRRINHIHGLLGTACNVMAMVYGNKDDNSGTGVLFTRSPSNGQKWAGKCDDGTPALYGEFLVNAQGEDVVSGVRTPLGMDDMHRRMPDVYNELVESVRRLEAHQGDAQDIEFTVESGKLYILQTRDAKRTGPAALRIACDLVEEGIATKRHAVRKLVSPEHVSQLLLPRVDPEEVKAYQKEDQEWTSAGEPKYSEGASPSAAPPKPSTRLIGKGLAASPGGATGKIVFSAAAAEAEAKAGRGPVLLVRVDTSPEDIGGMHAAAGVLTATGGMTSHAAVVARGWGKPCVAGCGDLAISYRDGTVTSRRTGQVLRGGDWLSINASEGDVVVGRVKLVDPANMGVKEGGEGGDSKPAAASSGSGSGGDSSDAVDEDAARLASLLSWADSELGESESDAFAVQANADTPADAIRAIHLGARGIGLTRTEHQWFGSAAKLMAVRRMILSSDEGDRRRALEKMKPYQEDDFRGIYEGVLGATGERLQTGNLRAPSSGALEVPVTVRLLDPPLHEFLPQPGSRQAKAVAEDLGISDDELGKAVRRLHESNPMLGHRGCRLGITKPDVTAMQAAAITRAALEGVTNIARKARDEGWKHVPTLAAQIMVPLVSCEKELSDQRQVVVDAVRGEVLRWHREKETEDEASSSAGGTTESKTAEPARASSSVSRKYSGPTGPGVATLEGLALPSGLVIRVGTMIETPRAALLAGRLAEQSDFFSYGTNDLHQMTYGFSRDDAGTFIPAYIDKGILKDDPFQTVDQEGVGILMDMSVKSGRETAKGRHFSVGVCGEHGGDARSIEFFVRKLKIDYVSCSPMRVPAALLAAAAARIREQDEQAASKKSSEAKVASTESGTKVAIGGTAASGAGATSS